MNEKKSNIERKFRLSFFPAEYEYSEKEVNGFYLIKQYNSKLRIWTVALFNQKSYMNKKKHQEQFKGKRYKVTRRNRR